MRECECPEMVSHLYVGAGEASLMIVNMALIVPRLLSHKTQVTTGRGLVSDSS